MNVRDHKAAKVLTLSALLAGVAGLAGCGTYATTGTGSGTSEGDSYRVECRRGIVNDPYPGICHDYVDADGDNICDLSQPVDDTSSLGSSLATNADETDASQGYAGGGCPLAPCVVCGICAELG